MKMYSVSFRLTEDAKTLLEAAQKKLGVSKTSVIEMSIREFARSQNIALPHSDEQPSGGKSDA